MESTHGLHAVEFVESKFDELSKNPEIYSEPQSEKTEDFKKLSEKSYSIAINNNKNFKGRALSKLLIDRFDEEQIWQLSDLLNTAAESNISKAIRLINPKDIFCAVSKTSEIRQSSVRTDNEISTPNEGNAFSNEESSAEEYAFDDDSDSLSEMETVVKKASPIKEGNKKEKPSYISEVDDQFFKLSKLEEFLKIEDLKEEKGDASDPEQDIDLFQDIPSDGINEFDEESDEEKEKTYKSSKDLMYEDFFDDPESEVGDESDDSMNDHDETMMEENEDTSHGIDPAAEVNGSQKDSNLEEDTEKSVGNEIVKKTAFELEQEKIRKKIQECEKGMLDPLPWHLTGEVDATKRPIDSLIHQEADFDSNVKQDIVVDNLLTERTEEITRLAIMNKAFLDVERKYKPTEDIIAYKKEVALEQTKSKKSLAEVYEESYLKKQSKHEEEQEDPKHKEIKKLMDSLLPELHALFSHIPKPAIPEIKIVTNLPAVTVEEVAPTSVSDVTLLAPEEVKKKSGQIKGQTERTETDRKRERRKKKLHQKLKEKKRLEKLETQKGNPSAKITKLEKLQTLKKLKQHRNTKIANVDEGGKIKSSKDFFSRLQDTVDLKNRTKSQTSHRKK